MNPVNDARYGIPLTRFTSGGLIGEALLVSIALLLNFNQHCDDILMVAHCGHFILISLTFDNARRYSEWSFHVTTAQSRSMLIFRWYMSWHALRQYLHF